MSIPPEIHLIYHENIWNIFTVGEKYLLLELRDSTTLATFFDLYDIEKKVYQWQGFSLQENWRIGVSHTHDEKIIFHQYGRGAVPSIDRLICIGVESRKVLWTIENFQPVAFGKDFVKGVRDNELLLLSITNGEFVTDIESFREEEKINAAQIPFTYIEGTDDFKVVHKFVDEYFKKDAIGLAEYIEHNNDVIFSYQLKELNKIIVYLIGLDTDGCIWIKEKIQEGDKLFSDTFFIWKNYLLFTEGKHVLKGINIKGK